MKDQKLTTLIVDDMPHAVELLKRDIESNCPNLDIIGTANGVVEAAKLYKKLKPDLLLLDISLGDGTGFDLLDIIGHQEVRVIFITAYDEYAIKAFKYSAVDYLLKPVDIEELVQAVDKVLQTNTVLDDNVEVLKEVYKNNTDKITLRTADQILVVQVDEIVRCASDNNCTWFYFVDGTKLFVSKTLKFYQDLLEEKDFMRVHQSHLINFKHFKTYSKKEGGYIVMDDGEKVPVSIRKKQDLMMRVNEG